MKKITPSKGGMGKDLNFTGPETRMVNKHMKTVIPSLVIRGMQIKTTGDI